MLVLKWVWSEKVNTKYWNLFTCFQFGLLFDKHKMYNILIVWIFLSCSKLIAQNNYDYLWPLAFHFNNNVSGASILNFNTMSGPPNIIYDEKKSINYKRTCAPISDKFGNLLFSYNGLFIEDASNNIMENGNAFSGWSLNDGLNDGGIVLPHPKKNYQYILIHETWTYINGLGTAGDKLYYSIIDMTKNNGLGAVISKNNLIFSDTLDYGKVSAVRHANGRDWWVIIPKYNSNVFFRFIANSDGVYYFGKQIIGSLTKSGFGQSSFSPDGRYYANFSTINENSGAYVDVYNFDRCLGELSNHQQFFFPIGKASGGVAFSSDANFLYISYHDYIYQVDLSDSIYVLDIIANYDGYITEPSPGFFVPTYFGFLRLAPDGKIYCTPSIAPSDALHSIDKPNLPGIACKVSQHSVLLPLAQQCLPNFPNYRLGSLDSSLCDTINLDNRPISCWRYDQSPFNHLQVEFQDLSYYEPDSWYWDFGDGFSSTERHPVHTFVVGNVYNVCLLVSNKNNADTLCRKLSFDTSTTQDFFEPKEQIQVTPNPFRNKIVVKLSTELQNPYFSLHDKTNILFHRVQLRHGINEITVPNLPVGIYFWEIQDHWKHVKSGKLIRIND